MMAWMEAIVIAVRISLQLLTISTLAVGTKCCTKQMSRRDHKPARLDLRYSEKVILIRPRDAEVDAGNFRPMP
jgi:hypothetical protein